MKSRLCVVAAAGWIAVLPGAFGAREAHAFDDPAVAACQYTVFRGQDPARKGYRRLEAEIDGLTVRLVFERSVLNTRPKTSGIECRYLKLDTGEFIMTPDLPVDEADPAVRECRELMTEGPKKIDGGTLDVGETSLIRTRMGLCERTLGLRPELAATLKPLLEELTSIGIYPIAPADTELRPAD